METLREFCSLRSGENFLSIKWQIVQARACAERPLKIIWDIQHLKRRLNSCDRFTTQNTFDQTSRIREACIAEISPRSRKYLSSRLVLTSIMLSPV